MSRVNTSRLMYFLFCLIAFNACYNPNSKCKYIDNYDDTTKVWGWKPKFQDVSIFQKITFDSSRSINKAGKIYIYNNYLLQAESGEGIHIVDVTNKNNPRKVGFIVCKGAEEIEMKDGYLITNNLNDLVTLQVNFSSKTLTVAKRLPNALTLMDKHYSTYLPPDTGFYLCNYRQFNVVESWSKDSIIRNQSCYNFK